MTTQQMRMIISNVYTSKSWKYKVSKMSDGQVTAIFYSFRKNGKIR